MSKDFSKGTNLKNGQKKMDQKTADTKWEALGDDGQGQLLCEFYQREHCKTGTDIEFRTWMSKRTGIPIEYIPEFEGR